MAATRMMMRPEEPRKKKKQFSRERKQNMFDKMLLMTMEDEKNPIQIIPSLERIHNSPLDDQQSSKLSLKQILRSSSFQRGMMVMMLFWRIGMGKRSMLSRHHVTS